MSEMAATLGVPLAFEFEGVEYKVGQRDFEVETHLVQYLCDRDLETVQRFAHKLSPAEYQAQLSDWRKGVTAGVWSFGSPDFVRFYVSKPGLLKSAYFQLKKFNPALKESVIDRIWDDDAKWTELMEKMGMANADPTPAAATTT